MFYFSFNISLRGWFRLGIAALVLQAIFLKFVFASPDYHVQIQFKPDPIQVGDNTAVATVKDLNGSSVANLNLYLRTTMPGMSMPMSAGIRPWPAKEITPGVYQIPFNISMLGDWDFDLLSDRPGGSSEKLLSIEKIVKPAGHAARNLVPAFFAIAILFAIFASRRKITLRGIASIFLFFILLAIGYAFTKRLKKQTYPGQTSLESMGMKMKMNAPDMGMSTRILSAPQAVSTEVVKPGPLDQTTTYTGTVAPDLEETVYPRVTGWLIHMPFYPGMRVHAGEIIGQLDTSQLQPDTEEAREKFAASREAIEEARLQLLEMKDKVKETKASLDYWQKEIVREKNIFREGGVSEEEYDQEKSRYLESLARYHAAQRSREASQKEINRLNALSLANLASLKAASAVENYAVLTAHINGIVTARLVNQGVLVQPGTGILKISKIDFVRLQANVAESELDNIKVGTPVLISSPKIENREQRGEVTSIFYNTDPLTHTGKVEARIANIGENFFQGDFVTMIFLLKQKFNALTVRSASILPYQETPKIPNIPEKYKYFVWVVGKDRLAHRLFVVPGISNESRTEIVKGLKPGDEVIDEGEQNLQEMDPVTLVKGD